MKKFFEAIFEFAAMLPPQVKKLLQEAFDYAKKLECEIEQLKSEIARLKNVPEKPTIKNNGDKNQNAPSTENNRGGSNKGNRKKKKTHIKIHEEIVIRVWREMRFTYLWLK